MPDDTLAQKFDRWWAENYGGSNDPRDLWIRDLTRRAFMAGAAAERAEHDKEPEMTNETETTNSTAWFHARDGWYFRRVLNEPEEAGVAIVHTEDGQPPAEDEPLVVGDHSLVVDANTWASIVAHVSQHGDTAESWGQVRRFHDKRWGSGEIVA